MHDQCAGLVDHVAALESAVATRTSAPHGRHATVLAPFVRGRSAPCTRRLPPHAHDATTPPADHTGSDPLPSSPSAATVAGAGHPPASGRPSRPAPRARAASAAPQPPTRAGAICLAAATGITPITAPASPPSSLPVPPGANAARMLPLLTTAALLIRSIPVTSQAKIDGACARFREALTFWALSAPCEQAVVAYVIARCCPPVGTEVPPSCARPVLPQTAASDIDALRRAARLNMHDMGPHLESLSSDGVSELLRSIGGRMKRLKTCKRALLYHEVSAAWDEALSVGTANAIRDAFALVVAFFYGMRVSELVSLKPEDVHPIELAPGELAMQITFHRVKNRQSILRSHDPFVVTCGHPLLTRAWETFEAFWDYFDSTTVFHTRRGSTLDPLSRKWFADIVARAAPSATPHSARVGLATEMWAAGASIEDIMAAGRWTSPTAVMYVIGSLEGQVQATRTIGTGLVYSGNDLRRLGASPAHFTPASRPRCDAQQWAAIASRAECD